ncbi:MAG: indolepyruvate oxidoreductase subunit beta [Anaerolineae bacterium]|nr:indolepyruvate oxidoreductase subunit beta [Anaerolineae bacterium]MDW8068005.1 indolepyruvate oxidoreductase subunit beta [Anaerolineae bacterium]
MRDFRAAAEWNFLFVGVGGQGVLTASDIAAQVGLDLGLEAKKSEVHGFAQRGGVVESHVRWGKRVGAPIAEPGTVDILVAFELLEAVRWIEWLRPGGSVVVNRQKIAPMSVTVGNTVYPEEAAILDALRRRAARVVLVDGLSLARQVGTIRAVNSVILGALSALLETPPEVWEEAIIRRVPPRYVEANQAAFRLGREAALHS